MFLNSNSYLLYFIYAFVVLFHSKKHLLRTDIFKDQNILIFIYGMIARFCNFATCNK